MKRSPIRSVSSRTAARNRSYSAARRLFLAARPVCEARLHGCTGIATEVHHRAGRGVSVFFDESLWLPVCHPDHVWITEHPAEAYRLGLSVHRNVAS